MSVDIIANTRGKSIALLYPQTPDGHLWLSAHVDRENSYQPWWPVVLVESRYINNVIDGMIDSGLLVEVT